MGAVRCEMKLLGCNQNFLLEWLDRKEIERKDQYTVNSKGICFYENFVSDM